MKRELFTVSNVLSISRAVLVVPFSLVMLFPDVPQRAWGGVIIALAILTDKFDGVLARKLRQESELGKILDPLADKIGIAGVALVMLHLGDIPLWFVAALILRDAVIFLGGITIKATRGVVLTSNLYGKWTVGIVAFTLLRALLGVVPEAHTVLMAASVGGLMLSFVMYVVRFIQLMHRPRE